MAEDIDRDGVIDAPDILETWQAKLLRHSDGILWKVCLSVIAHSYDRSMFRLLDKVYPGFLSIDAPFFCSAAKIAKTGHICADVCTREGHIIRMYAIFDGSWQMESAFRHMADGIKLNDADRIELFAAVNRWVVCDYRIDPTMDPLDPDARRLTVN